MLRRACQQRILTGWNGPHVTGSYTINPRNEGAGEWSADRVHDYVLALEHAGFDPLWRESEPA